MADEEYNIYVARADYSYIVINYIAHLKARQKTLHYPPNCSPLLANIYGIKTC